jgi:hypothetical protein
MEDTAMKLSEIRNALVADHAALKQEATQIEAEVQRILAGEPSLNDLRAAMDRFAGQLATHNHHEESLLREELRNVDAWGPQREALMDEDHAAEHADIARALSDAGRLSDPKEVARRVHAMVERVFEHMRREEKEILHPDVLRDDVVTIMGASE